jgi:hypothetical protein
MSPLSPIMPPWILRIVLLLAAWLAMTAGRIAIELQAGRGPIRESIALAVWWSSHLGAGALILAACLPQSWWRQIGSNWGVARWAGWLAPRPLEEDRRVPWLSLGVTTGLLVGLLAACAPYQLDYLGTDQEAYVLTAQEIAARGGPAGLLRDLLSGEFAEANRHPLYLALLAVHPTYDWGKTLSAIAAVLVHLLLIVLAARWLGRTTATRLAWIHGLNSALVTTGITVACETWLTLILLLTLAAALAASAARQRGDLRAELLWTIAFGAGLGLGWLTKGSVLPLIAGTLVWLLVVSDNEAPSRSIPGPELPGSKPGANRFWRRGLMATLVLLSAAVVASPLLVRNVTRFRSATYNVNSWLMFVDRYEDPYRLARDHSLSDLARRYVRDKGVVGLAEREGRGLVWEGLIVARALGPVGLGEGRALPGLVLAALALLGWWTLPNRACAELILAWTIPAILLFAWYVPIAAGERFIAPLVPLWLLLAASARFGSPRHSDVSPTPHRFGSPNPEEQTTSP